jgi:alkylation response protein AidB-like acyl-CoA dehydrogenase
MDLRITGEELAFRDEVRSFLDESLPSEIRDKVLSGRRVTADDTRRWQQILHRKGWGAPAWPKEHGGTGWDPVRQYIFDQETGVAGAPRMLPFGLKMVGPVIMKFGNEAQKKKYLPRIVSGEDWWCQGYSEPEAGSDLASVRTRAEQRGDHYLVNGQKTWITLAQHANWIFCLVRTNSHVKPQAGISFLLIDMTSPGVAVRPITLLDGSQEVNEVWLEDVQVPRENLVGEENQGWTAAKFLLGHERANIAAIGSAKRELGRLKAIARQTKKNGRPIAGDPLFAPRLAQVEIDLMALEITSLRVLSAEAQRRAPGPESSLLKLQGTTIQQSIQELRMDVAGYYSQTLQGDLSEDQLGHDFADLAQKLYFRGRASSIYGGSDEVQKNVTAKHVLGL